VFAAGDVRSGSVKRLLSRGRRSDGCSVCGTNALSKCKRCERRTDECILFGATVMVGQGVLRDACSIRSTTCQDGWTDCDGRAAREIAGSNKPGSANTRPLRWNCPVRCMFLRLGVSSAGMKKPTMSASHMDTTAAAETLSRLITNDLRLCLGGDGQYRTRANHVGACQGQDRERSTAPAFKRPYMFRPASLTLCTEYVPRRRRFACFMS